ncbi:MAG: hypothetical protein MI725_12080, partial [Pirellulales bacterium]|nr:hypothetical protein [Pirellulales bacterium]
MNFKIWFCPLGLLCFSFSAATGRADEHARFQSNWKAAANRTWVGASYWANPLQDWRVHGGRLECVFAGANRNVHLLTHQLTSQSEATISVTLSKPPENVKGWVGFRIAAHGLFDDYRHAVIYGRGIDAGWTGDNHLLLGEKREPIKAPAELLSDGKATLRLKLAPEGKQHGVKLELLGKDDVLLGSVRATFDSADMRGNLALVCHQPKKQQKSRRDVAAQKPVATFSDWRLEGSQLAGSAAQAWGPIFWCQYTLSRNVLKLTAQFPPLGPD